MAARGMIRIRCQYCIEETRALGAQQCLGNQGLAEQVRPYGLETLPAGVERCQRVERVSKSERARLLAVAVAQYARASLGVAKPPARVASASN